MAKSPDKPRNPDKKPKDPARATRAKAARPDAPQTPDELAALPWVSVSHFYRDEVTLTHARTGDTVRVAVQPRMYTDNLYAMRSAAALGMGAALGSRWALREELDAGRLVQLVPEWQAAPLPIWLDIGATAIT